MYKLHRNNDGRRWKNSVLLSSKVVTSVNIGDDEVVLHVARRAVTPGTESVGSRNKLGISFIFVMEN